MGTNNKCIMDAFRTETVWFCPHIEFIQPAYCALIQTKQTLEKIVKWYLYCTDNSYSVRFFKIKKNTRC